MARDVDSRSRLVQAHGIFIRLVLPPYTIHFKSATYMKESTLEFLDKKVCKEALRSTAQDAAVRASIGKDVRFWTELCALLKAAIPSLERRSFSIWDPSSVDYESTSGSLIASHYPGLWKDLERVNDLISISRNILTVGDAVQNLAALSNIDAEIFRLINCCVRVTARGYDGDASTGEEEKWQWIVNAYKKLLITCLQFLNNLVAQNEKRKLSLWVSLFDSLTDVALGPEDVPETSTASLTDVPSNPTALPSPPLDDDDILIAFGTNGRESVDTSNALPLWDNTPFSDWPLPEEALEGKAKLQGNGYAFFVKGQYDFCFEDYHTERKRDPTPGEMHLDIPRRWYELDKEDRGYWQRSYEDAVVKYRQDIAVYEAKMMALNELRQLSAANPLAAQILKPRDHASLMKQSRMNHHLTILPDVSDATNIAAAAYLPPLDHDLHTRQIVMDDMRMLFTADAGSKILESGKTELMRRLEGYEQPPLPESLLPTSRQPECGSVQVFSRVEQLDRPGGSHRSSPLICTNLTRSGRAPIGSTASDDAREGSPTDLLEGRENQELEQDGEDEDEDEDEDEESEDAEEDEEDYPGSTEDGRGLLTDVPLILGPSEIEVLPMLIMSGIVPPVNQTHPSPQTHRDDTTNLYTVRTHLLLSQSNGRNLLRELLIFVAAWDLREEELYFKFMVKILEAILQNGLMPYAYHAFRDRSRSKDIISPAQAVIMKLLTCIFRARGELVKANVAAAAHARTTSQVGADSFHSAPWAIPSPPKPTRVDLRILNFIFTEFRQHIVPQTCALIFLQGQIHAGKASPEDFPLNLWDMERMYEGVYQYLEFFAVLTEEGVWKGILGEWEMASELVTLLRELEGGIPKVGAMTPRISKQVNSHHDNPALIAHVNQDPSALPALTPDSDGRRIEAILPPLPNHLSQDPVLEGETPLAYPEDSSLPLGHDLQHDQDEPSDFEWRNLKKLTVLVLSSLIWKNKLVQDQVRKYKGLEALVSCCRPDEHNPYIREHAIMCLRFAVEGCEENAQVIKRMANSQNKRAHPTGSSSANAEDIPREVLDTNGYETFMDPKGQVGLRRKEGIQTPHQIPITAPSAVTAAGSGISKARFNSNATKMTAEKAAELMQNALRELPLGDNFVTDKQKVEALAKLDRAFESTEKVLGKNRRV